MKTKLKLNIDNIDNKKEKEYFFSEKNVTNNIHIYIDRSMSNNQVKTYFTK